MHFKFIILTIFLSIYGVCALVECPVGICTRANCVNVDKTECEAIKDGIFVERGGLCGCCPTCLHKIREGENCHSTLLFGAPHTAACDIGLVCNPDTQVCTKQ